jgi:hypothetical protein
VDAKKGEKKQQEDSMKKTSTRKPNVRVRK